MNREEAIQKAERALNDPIAKGGGITLLELDHLRVLLEALRGPQPDPITGLVPCGGRRAVLWFTTGEGFWAACCGVSQANRYETEAFAIKAWNESMGYTAPPRPGAIEPETGEMAPNGDEGATHE